VTVLAMSTIRQGTNGNRSRIQHKPKQLAWQGYASANSIWPDRTSFGQANFLWYKLAGVNPDKPLQTGRTLLRQTSFWETLNWRGIWYKPRTTTFYSWPLSEVSAMPNGRQRL